MNIMSIRHFWSICTCVAVAFLIASCAPKTENQTEQHSEDNSVSQVSASQEEQRIWPKLSPPALDPEIEARVDEILSVMTLEQKVGQVIQGDSDSTTPEDVKKYALGSVLSGGNSAPGDLPYADTQSWLADADKYFQASLDVENVEIAIPLIWGIDAVHGHANLTGATVFPHNIGLGAANDPDLIEEIMEVTAAELIVSGHDWTFAPTLAVPRDDRWGRSYEGFSEDPEIVKAYGERIVFGLQGRPGTDEFFADDRVISSAKHFIGDGGTTDGVDQGDTALSEQSLRDIHAPGYFSAINADVKTVMASFNSWNGEKLHGSRTMLTDVLKDQMGFTGFVIGDWNGHGQIEGCTNTDCPQSLIAGVDMYMAPDSWEKLYETTLAAAQSGELPMERLDDAVRRILRVKIQAGIFEKPKPSERPGAGRSDLLGSKAHRDLARRAVRQSLVLLKNNDNTLPISSGKTVLVVGDGADNISKQAGGWTLSWQGGGYKNSDFPNGQSILSGIQAVVESNGGRVIFDEEGQSDVDADIVIAVYGEDPYAEFLGDLSHLDFEPNGWDTTKLSAYSERGIPVVSVFLSGRPLWMNPEINASDAFVAAWLPGTEGAGIADLLFRTDPSFDFTGRLSFSWPKKASDFSNNIGEDGYDPLFKFGYGLSYDTPHDNLGDLSEDNGLDDITESETGDVFRRGDTIAPWQAHILSPRESALFSGVRANITGLSASRADHLAQEDAIRLAATRDDVALIFNTGGNPRDWSRQSNAALELLIATRSVEGVEMNVGMGCSALECSSTKTLNIPASSEWSVQRLALSCFAKDGVDFSTINWDLVFQIPAGASLDLADIHLGEDDDGVADCGE